MLPFKVRQPQKMILPSNIRMHYNIRPPHIMRLHHKASSQNLVSDCPLQDSPESYDEVEVASPDAAHGFTENKT